MSIQHNSDGYSYVNGYENYWKSDGCVWNYTNNQLIGWKKFGNREHEIYNNTQIFKTKKELMDFTDNYFKRDNSESDNSDSDGGRKPRRRSQNPTRRRKSRRRKPTRRRRR